MVMSVHSPFSLNTMLDACAQGIPIVLVPGKYADFGMSPGEMPERSCMQSVSAQRGKRYTEIGLFYRHSNRSGST